MRPTSDALATLATLRHADAGDPAADVRVWQVTFDGIPDELLADRPGATASRAERAVHAALVLWSRHQQAKTSPMHVSGRSLGLAARDLSRKVEPGDELSGAVLRRFHSVATATGDQQRLYHLRSLVSLFRAHDVALDYARLAEDLYRLETPRADAVQLSWGRDLHRRDRSTTTETTSTAEPTRSPS
ncbi:MAG TPA: type I-E CRISPR-associated protein Cse2/CasB [Dermatophilaceae bacterium]|nr:type I-E CRISPR-associated protein Cse2/CasB [Dermatophilaceae bacterium]